MTEFLWTAGLAATVAGALVVVFRVRYTAFRNDAYGQRGRAQTFTVGKSAVMGAVSIAVGVVCIGLAILS